MRTAVRNRRAVRQKVSITETFPAPISGWNARDGLASMQPTDAIVLKNWYPRPSYVEFRGGWAEHATGMAGGNAKTLMVYNKMNGTNELFAATTNWIYNVSSAGAVGGTVITSRTSGKYQWVMFGDGTNNWLIAVNGVDDPAYYDGTTWVEVDETTSPALTGYTGDAVEQFISVNVFKERLFFIPINSLSVWYLPAGAAGGALTEFDLSAEAVKGGYIMAMATWTRDAGSGPDDFAVFLTSEGQAIIYQGTNPSSATTWGKVGSFTIGKPLGRRCVMQYAGDCVVITENGIFPLSSLLQSGDERAKFAMSYKIQNSIVNAARSYGDTFGWKAITFPAYDAMLVNVPIAEDGEHEQYVMNTLTKAWCQFTEWDAEDFAVFNKELYYCIGDEVRKCWTGTIDGEDDIVFYGKQAFQDYGDSNQKHVQMLMPMLSTNGQVAYSSDVDLDFADDEIVGAATYAVEAGAVWNASNFDESYWASGVSIVRQWSSPSDWTGRWVANKLKIASNSLEGKWMANILMYVHGDGI